MSTHTNLRPSTTPRLLLVLSAYLTLVVLLSQELEIPVVIFSAGAPIPPGRPDCHPSHPFHSYHAPSHTPSPPLLPCPFSHPFHSCHIFFSHTPSTLATSSLTPLSPHQPPTQGCARRSRFSWKGDACCWTTCPSWPTRRVCTALALTDHHAFHSCPLSLIFITPHTHHTHTHHTHSVDAV